MVLNTPACTCVYVCMFATVSYVRVSVCIMFVSNIEIMLFRINCVFVCVCACVCVCVLSGRPW